jgi:hypothetical protein
MLNLIAFDKTPWTNDNNDCLNKSMPLQVISKAYLKYIEKQPKLKTLKPETKNK